MEKGRETEAIFFLSKMVTGYFIKQSQRGAAGFLDRLVAARQTERAQMRDAFDAFVGDEEKFAAPNRAVQTVAGAVPRNAKHWWRDFIFRHARQHMGDVVLDADELQGAGSAGCQVGTAEIRPAEPTLLRKFR